MSPPSRRGIDGLDREADVIANDGAEGRASTHGTSARTPCQVLSARQMKLRSQVKPRFDGSTTSAT